MLKNEKGQAVAPKTVTMTKKDFEDQGNTRCLLYTSPSPRDRG